ncbi:unnamed protein product [Chrysoparadoxa australica]
MGTLIHGLDPPLTCVVVSGAEDNDHVYVTGGSPGSLVTFSRDPVVGHLDFVSALVEGQDGVQGLADAISIHVFHPFVYVISNAPDGGNVAIFREDPCLEDLTCLNDAVCAKGTCICAVGWMGDTCQLSIDDCAEGPCHNGATCVDNHLGYTCLCEEGYEGAQCAAGIDDCIGIECVNGGLCIDHHLRYSCDCPETFSGEHCEIDVNECLDQPCQNGGSCLNFSGGFQCDCQAGWEGEFCQSNINDCIGAVCSESCLDQVHSFICTSCPKGYSGLQCETDINDCEGITCQAGATCMDLIGSYYCTCGAAGCDELMDADPDAVAVDAGAKFTVTLTGRRQLQAIDPLIEAKTQGSIIAALGTTLGVGGLMGFRVQLLAFQIEQGVHGLEGSFASRVHFTVQKGPEMAPEVLAQQVEDTLSQDNDFSSNMEQALQAEGLSVVAEVSFDQAQPVEAEVIPEEEEMFALIGGIFGLIGMALGMLVLAAVVAALSFRHLTNKLTDEWEGPECDDGGENEWANEFEDASFQENEYEEEELWKQN